MSTMNPSEILAIRTNKQFHSGPSPSNNRVALLLWDILIESTSTWVLLWGACRFEPSSDWDALFSKLVRRFAELNLRLQCDYVPWLGYSTGWYLECTVSSLTSLVCYKRGKSYIKLEHIFSRVSVLKFVHDDLFAMKDGDSYPPQQQAFHLSPQRT